jgi:hypothetical protein
MLDTMNLKVGDEVGIVPSWRSDRCAIGTVVRVMKAQIWVRVGTDTAQKFIRRNGKEYGASAYSYKFLVSKEDALERNRDADERQRLIVLCSQIDAGMRVINRKAEALTEVHAVISKYVTPIF